jgi:hypothetical protein
MSTFLFPLDQVEEYIRSFKEGVKRDVNTIIWNDYDGVTSLKVDVLNQSTSDGLDISEQISLEHSSEALSKYNLTELAHLNRLSTTGAMLSADENHFVRMVSKVGIFSQDKQAAERNYAPIIAGACAMIGWHAALIARGQLEVDPETSPLNNVGDETQVALSDLETAAETLRKNQFFLNQDSDSLTVEFPWDEGAVSNVFLEKEMREAVMETNSALCDEDMDRMAGKTSLLQIKKSSHPYFGNGVFASLELPISTEQAGLPQLIDVLNQWEFLHPDLPPQFGSWCIGPRSPSFVTFLPNQLCIPGVVQNLVMWNLVRAFRVRDFVAGISGTNNSN